MKPYYERDGIVLYHADCLDVLPQLGPGSVDRVITSPPYNLGNSSGGGFPMGHYSPSAPMGKKRGGCGKWSGGSLAKGYGVHNDAMPHEEYVAWQKDVLAKCWGLLSDTGAIFYNHKSRIFNGRLVTPLEYNPGLPVRQVIIWARAGGINFSPAFYVPTHEWVVMFAKDAFRLKSKGASGVGDVWQLPQESNNPHPAPFPVDLPLRIIETAGGKTILDPFAGSCTTLLAAWNLGRKAIGIEISEEYCELGAKRLDAEMSRGRLFAPEPEPVEQTNLEFTE